MTSQLECRDAEDGATALKIGVPRERTAGERRVALVPEAAGRIATDDTQVLVETGAGDEAGFPDAQYAEAGVTVVPDAARLYAEADLIVRVGRPSEEEIEAMRPETVLVAVLGSLSYPRVAEELAARGVTSLSMDLV